MDRATGNDGKAKTMEILEKAQSEAARCGLTLQRSAEGLALSGDGMTLRADFHELIPRIKPGRLQRELLVRAAKTKQMQPNPPFAVDATAGLGEDAFLLAAAGFRVMLFERNPVIAALLQDALQRASADPQLGEIIARMELSIEDSITALEAMGDAKCTRDAEDARGAETVRNAAPTIVYLDPMFPARQKSAAVKKKFQLLHHLEDPCEDAEELLHAAFAAHPRKIIVKRPPKGPNLAGIKPSYALAGKAVRYDVIALPEQR